MDKDDLGAGASRPKVAHLSSVHNRQDNRIMLKQIASLSAAGYKVFFLVRDGEGACRVGDVDIVDAGKPQSRMTRVLGSWWLMFVRARALKADIYHHHDPELLLTAVLLKLAGARVIFDSHEDVPKQVLSKPYLPRPLRPIVAAAAEWMERMAGRYLDGVIGATPSIAGKFDGMGARRSQSIANYPRLTEYPDHVSARDAKQVCYVGAISQARGLVELVRAVGECQSGARLCLIGSIDDEATRRALEAEQGWARTDYYGPLPRHEAVQHLQRSVAGIVTFLPHPNHIEAQPNKLFEYMACSLPVVASDFPAWREIVEASQCGFCVNPADSGAIAQAIDRLCTDPALAERLGTNGRRLVLSEYNWEREAERLLDFYKRVERAPA